MPYSSYTKTRPELGYPKHNNSCTQPIRLGGHDGIHHAHGQNDKHFDIVPSNEPAALHFHALSTIKVKPTPSILDFTHLLKFISWRLNRTKRQPVQPLLLCRLLAVPPEQGVRKTYVRSLIDKTVKRHIKRPSRTKCSYTARAHRRAVLLPAASIRIMMHAATINHRHTPNIREPPYKSTRI